MVPRDTLSCFNTQMAGRYWSCGVGTEDKICCLTMFSKAYGHMAPDLVLSNKIMQSEHDYVGGWRNQQLARNGDERAEYLT